MPKLKRLFQSLLSRFRDLTRRSATYRPEGLPTPSPGDVSTWYRDSAFPLYGLPMSWEAIRGIGTTRISRNSDNQEHATRLTLTHVLPGSGDLNVSSYLAEATSRVVKLYAVSDLARRVAGSPATAREAVHRAESVKDLRQRFLSQQAIEHVIFSIDGEEVVFDVIRSGHHWLGLGRLSDVVVQLDASGVSSSDVQLTRITDVEPYLDS